MECGCRILGIHAHLRRKFKEPKMLNMAAVQSYFRSIRSPARVQARHNDMMNRDTTKPIQMIRLITALLLLLLAMSRIHTIFTHFACTLNSPSQQ